MQLLPTQATFSLKNVLLLLRIIAVVFSSMAAILSTTLPLFFYYSLSSSTILTVTVILFIGTLLIHGLLTHTFNDIADNQSGTDNHSPGLLSGGSRVIQNGTMTMQMLIQLGIWLSLISLLFMLLFFYFGYPKFAILTIIGIWGAISYSLKPFQFAYYPFIGEWFSLFPTMLFIGVAAPWILLDNIPIWAWQNGLINAIWCIAWVMVHHIPDRHADRKANPIKRTSIVWAEDIFGEKAMKGIVLFYFTLVGILLIWISFTRPLAALLAAIILIYSIYLTLKMNVNDVEEVTKIEKKLLFMAFTTAICIGIFI